MKKNLNFKLITWLLVGSFIIGAPGSLYCMETIKAKLVTAKEKAQLLARYRKDIKLRKVVDQFRETKELRRKKKAGTATKAELRILEKRMKKIKIAAAAIGVTLTIIAIIAAIVGGTYYIQSQHSVIEKETVIEKEISPIDKELQEITNAINNGDTNRILAIEPNSNLWKDFNDELLSYTLNQASTSPTNKLKIAKIFVKKAKFVKDASYINLMKQAFKMATQENDAALKEFFKTQIPEMELQFEEIESAIKTGNIDAISAIQTNSELWRKKNIKLLSLAIGQNKLAEQIKLEMAKILVEKGGFKEDYFYFRLIKQAYNLASRTNNEAMKNFFNSHLPSKTPPISVASTTIKISDPEAKKIIPHLAQKEKSEFTWYEILGVPENSSCNGIRRKYRELARRVHPDKNSNKIAAEIAFKAVQEANDQGKKTCDDE